MFFKIISGAEATIKNTTPAASPAAFREMGDENIHTAQNTPKSCNANSPNQVLNLMPLNLFNLLGDGNPHEKSTVRTSPASRHKRRPAATALLIALSRRKKPTKEKIVDSSFWQLKDQLKEYGLSPKEWRWKVIIPEKGQGWLENRNQPDLFLKGKWKPTKQKAPTWIHLEWAI